MGALLAATGAGAASIGDCARLDRISYLVGAPKQFYNGRVSVALVDTFGEPVSGSMHILVFLPTEPFGVRCVAVSQAAGTGGGAAYGFHDLAWAKLRADYHPERGLLLALPFSVYDGAGSRPGGDLRIRINLQGEGAVTLE